MASFGEEDEFIDYTNAELEEIVFDLEQYEKEEEAESDVEVGGDNVDGCSG